jgi:hypothetical protein
MANGGLVNFAVRLVLEGFNVLQVQCQSTRTTLKADFVPEGTTSRDTFVRVSGLATSGAFFGFSVAWNE